MSVSKDLGNTWTYTASPFPPISGGQRLVLRRLKEGPLLLISFTAGNRREPEGNGMTLIDQNGVEFVGHGMFAALSFDQGKTWPTLSVADAASVGSDAGSIRHEGSWFHTSQR